MTEAVDYLSAAIEVRRTFYTTLPVIKDPIENEKSIQQGMGSVCASRQKARQLKQQKQLPVGNDVLEAGILKFLSENDVEITYDEFDQPIDYESELLKLKLSIGPLDPLDPIKESIEIIPDIDKQKEENGVSAAPVEILKKFKCENCGGMSLVFNRPPSKIRTNRIRHNKRHLFVVEVSS